MLGKTRTMDRDLTRARRSIKALQSAGTAMPTCPAAIAATSTSWQFQHVAVMHDLEAMLLAGATSQRVD